jgi:D-3-phosphoglycerate dehydrogenase
MKVLFIDSAHSSLKKILENNGFTCEEDFFSPKEEIEKRISDYIGIVLRSRINIDKQFIDFFSSPLKRGRFIARVGSGMEHIDITYAESKGITVLSSPEGNRNAVAEHALGMLLALLNKICKANSEVKEGKWLREENRGTELEGKTIGIYGYGNTGSALAKILRGFDVKILAYDKYKSKFGNEWVKESSPEEIFAQADVLSLHLPLTFETKYLVNDSFLSRFKKNIYLINTSRGLIVNTSDLIRNLKSGKLLGACLDVLEYEETSFERLSPLEKSETEKEAMNYLNETHHVILTPHIAGWSHESAEKMAKILAEKILSLYGKLHF